MGLPTMLGDVTLLNRPLRLHGWERRRQSTMDARRTRSMRQDQYHHNYWLTQTRQMIRHVIQPRSQLSLDIVYQGLLLHDWSPLAWVNVHMMSLRCSSHNSYLVPIEATRCTQFNPLFLPRRHPMPFRPNAICNRIQ